MLLIIVFSEVTPLCPALNQNRSFSWGLFIQDRGSSQKSRFWVRGFIINNDGGKERLLSKWPVQKTIPQHTGGRHCFLKQNVYKKQGLKTVKLNMHHSFAHIYNIPQYTNRLNCQSELCIVRIYNIPQYRNRWLPSLF